MKGEDAVSPVIGTILILAIFISVGVTVFMVARPRLLEVQEQGTFDAVAGQIQTAMSDMKGLAVSGKVGVVKKPVVTMNDGLLRTEVGHYVALTIGIEDEQYGDVAGTTYTQGAHHDFYVTGWDPTSTTDETRVTVKNNGTSLSPPVVFQPQRLDDKGLWNDTGETAMTYQVLGIPVAFPTAASQYVDFANPLQTNVYRIQVKSADALVGEVYFYNQTRMVFTLEGETGFRSLIAEAGGVWTYEKGRYFSQLSSIYTPPSVYVGSGQFTLRVIDQDVTGGSVGGTAKLSFVMNLVREKDFARNYGLSILRMQFAGPDTDIWQNTLESEGFKKDTANAETAGVYYIFAEYHDNDRKAFPIHIIYSKIDMQVKNS